MHFQKVFTCSNTRGEEEVLNGLPSLVTSVMNAQLLAPFTESEVKQAVFALGGMKAPDLDGFLRIFYQHYWETLHCDMFNAVKSFYDNGFLLKEMNRN